MALFTLQLFAGLVLTTTYFGEIDRATQFCTKNSPKLPHFLLQIAAIQQQRTIGRVHFSGNRCFCNVLLTLF